MTEQERNPQHRVPPVEGAVSRTGPVISLVGAALVVLGALMPWATLSTAFGSVSIPGTEGDGEIVLILGVVIAVLATLELTRQPRLGLRIGVGVCAGIALLIGLIDFSSITDHIRTENLEAGVASVGAGLYAVLLGAGVAIAGAVLKRNQTVT